MSNHLNKLKDTADKLGIVYSPNIGDVALQKKIDAFEELKEEKALLKAQAGGEDSKPEVKVAPVKKDKAPKKLTDVEIRVMSAKSRVKVRIANLDNNNTGATTVFSGVHNQFMDLARVVPLNMVIALELALIEEIENRKYITSTPEIGENGKPTGNMNTIEAPAYAVVRL